MKKRVRDELKPGEKKWENRNLEEKIQVILKYRWKYLLYAFILFLIICVVFAIIFQKWNLLLLQLFLIAVIIIDIITLCLTTYRSTPFLTIGFIVALFITTIFYFI